MTVRKEDAADIVAIYAPYVTDTVIALRQSTDAGREFAKESASKTVLSRLRLNGKVIGYACASGIASAAYRYSAISLYAAPITTKGSEGFI